jgi:hypothetical protein
MMVPSGNSDAIVKHSSAAAAKSQTDILRKTGWKSHTTMTSKSL